jgi:Arc/MetJ-type ribon-helix-helix transcriptional regulator
MPAYKYQAAALDNHHHPMTQLSLQLTDELAHFVDHQVSSGNFTTAEELLLRALTFFKHYLEEHDSAPQEDFDVNRYLEERRREWSSAPEN